MPRMAKYLAAGIVRLGHEVEVRHAPFLWRRLSARPRAAKWLSYLDDYLVFGMELAFRRAWDSPGTVYVLVDQALAPLLFFMPRGRTVVHVNDLLAVRSALGEFPQNVTNRFGTIYQNLILRGLKRASRYIAISERTRDDVIRLACRDATRSTTVHLGLHFAFKRMLPSEAQAIVVDDLGLPDTPFILHVGGNQWYKNRMGVLAAYRAFVKRKGRGHQLWIVGRASDEAMLEARSIEDEFGGTVRFLANISDHHLCALYNRAATLFFPSIAEGFGWPIAEAMASGCLVVTSNDRPMSEVGGDCAFYVPVLHATTSLEGWADESSSVLAMAMDQSEGERTRRIQAGMLQAQRFNADVAVERYETIYRSALMREPTSGKSASS